jgi:hypothetical protein
MLREHRCVPLDEDQLHLPPGAADPEVDRDQLLRRWTGAR